MPNTAEYKNYLFVKVPEDCKRFDIHFSGSTVCCYGYGHIRIPVNNWQIIGKGDGIDWEGIVESHEFANKDNWARTDLWYKDYETKEYKWLATPTESGHSLLRSLDMEPGTTLVFKKNVK